MTRGPETALVNGHVRTVDDRSTVAEAILVRRGRIAAVGSESSIRARMAQSSHVEDLGGRTVIPGFIDAHNHLSVAAFEPDSLDCSTPPLSTMQELLERIAQHTGRVPKGRWIRGFGFQYARIREQRLPSRHELDEVAPDNPFFLFGVNPHIGSANSLALTEVGITCHSPQPWGGHIEFDRNGEPTGILVETGTNLLTSASWNSYARRDWDHAVELLSAKMRQYLAAGLTGVGDAMVTATSAELYRRADAAGALPFTVQQLHASDHWYAMQDLRRHDIIARVRESDSDKLRGGAMKVYVDRVYPDGPAMDFLHDGCKKHVGTAFYTKEEIGDLALRASALGINSAMHGMGNCAVDAILDAYEQVRRGGDSELTLRIEHAFIIEPEQAIRMAAVGVDVVVNPGLLADFGDDFTVWRGEDHGGDLRVLAIRTMLDAGVRVSLASDHPNGTFSPVEIIAAAVSRTTGTGQPVDPHESISATDALRLYTLNAAQASNRAQEEGSIEVGKRANLVILDADIGACPAHEIAHIAVDATYVDGERVYDRTTDSPAR